jgi:hypothetical protein
MQGNLRRYFLRRNMSWISVSITVWYKFQSIQSIDLSRIRFSDHETMAPSRGWTWCFHTFTVFYQVQPRLGTIVSHSGKVYFHLRVAGIPSQPIRTKIHKQGSQLSVPVDVYRIKCASFINSLHFFLLQPPSHW